MQQPKKKYLWWTLMNMLVSKEEYKSRLKTCNLCPHKSSINICKLCGCFVILKAKLAEAKCPDNRWNPC